jgi:ABC-type uncharacterized transport system involved in gliding motility auxiliary subunit
MKFTWLKARQTKYASYVTLYIAVILAVLAAVNWLADRHNKSYDATANKRFSLSEQTEKVVKGLKQDVKITYFDETIRFEQAQDLLGRYRNLSYKLTVEYIDPYRRPRQARAAGVTSVPATFVEAGKRKEEAKSLTESDLTSALIRALKGVRSVCAISGSGEQNLDDTGQDGYSLFKQILEKDNYNVRSITILEQPDIPKDCTVLLVGGPRKDYSDPMVKAVKSYVEGGGRALIALSPPVKLGRQEIGDNQGLVKVLAGWGVTLNRDFILDARGQRSGLGAEYSVVTDYESHPIGKEMKGTGSVFPFARSLEVKSVDKAQVEKLFSTGSSSYATANMAPTSVDPKREKKGPFALAAAGTYDSGKEYDKGRFVAVGSSEWLGNSQLYNPFFGNRDLVLNMVNWLSADEELIAIRPKSPEDRRLTLDIQKLWMIKYFSVFLIPLVIIGAGIGVWWRRR